MRGHKQPVESGMLADAGGSLRLFTDAPLRAGARIQPSESQIHYLLHVMRARAGHAVLLFNGRDGEWRAQISELTRRSAVLVCDFQTAAQRNVPDLWLAFAPVKKTPAEYLIQKSTELGVAVLIPVITDRTIVRRVNVERLHANAIEAAEQSGRLTIPDVRGPQQLTALLGLWPPERGLVFCDEAGDAAPIAEALRSSAPRRSWGLLTGPEGGFAPAERCLIREHPAVLPVTLGPRIMRADTAALAALAVWQAILGDWAVPSGL
jgi:16S rRNA (uracil1498-N3)-methyltransferase